MPATRRETDSFGTIDVPIDALWGAQTARSLHFFAIGEQRMPLPLIHALAWVKWAAARANRGLGLYFCKLAVEAHDGSINVETRGDLGAVFVVRLPVETAKPTTELTL